MSEIWLDSVYTESEMLDVRVQGLWAFNVGKTNGMISKPGDTVGFVLRNDAGEVVGGMECSTYLMSMEIDVLWVSDACIGKGYGHLLVREAERRARELDCLMMHVTTYSFQAPDFYQRQGFTVYGTLDGFPDGIRLYHLKKVLA